VTGGVGRGKGDGGADIAGVAVGLKELDYGRMDQGGMMIGLQICFEIRFSRRVQGQQIYQLSEDIWFIKHNPVADLIGKGIKTGLGIEQEILDDLPRLPASILLLEGQGQ